MTLHPLIEITALELDGHRDLTDEVCRGRALGCVVRGLVSGASAQAAVEALERAPRESIGAGEAFVHGCMLAPTVAHPEGPRFDEYLAAAAAWNAPGIFEHDVLGLVHRVLSALSQDRPVHVPRVPDGRAYAPATVRVFPDGTEVPTHCDTYRAMPCHEHLSSLTNADTHLSWYLPLSLPAAGGQLALYDARHGDDAPDLVDPERYTVGVGDLVFFDSGRYYHGITRIEGRPRRTFAGFARLSADGSCVYAWS